MTGETFAEVFGWLSLDFPRYEIGENFGRTIDRDKQVEECAILLAKLFASERNAPFWGNYVHQFRETVKDLTGAHQPIGDLTDEQIIASGYTVEEFSRRKRMAEEAVKLGNEIFAGL